MYVKHVRMAKTKLSLRIRYIPRFTTFFVIDYVYLKREFAESMPNKTLVSLRIIAVSMVHLYSKSLASAERCVCEKEVIRTACASLYDRCGGASEA